MGVERCVAVANVLGLGSMLMLVIYHWRPVRVRAPSGEAWAKDEREEITVTAEKCKERDEGARILGAMVTSAR